MFGEIQKDLLLKAREYVANGQQHFICCAITAATHAVSDTPYLERFRAGLRIKEEIEFAIDHYHCFELWLFSETGIYPDDLTVYARKAWDKGAHKGWTKPVSREQFDNWCKLARLAWIDRALERGEML